MGTSASPSSTPLVTTSTGMRVHRRDGYQSIRLNPLSVCLSLIYFPPPLHTTGTYIFLVIIQLVSVISLLSAYPPPIDSPANVDAAKEVRENLSGTYLLVCPLYHFSLSNYLYERSNINTGYRKKVLRLVRRSAEDAYA